MEDLYDAYERWAREQLDKVAQHDPKEVCEDGSVYLGNLAWLPAGTVTPWPEWAQENGVET